MRKLFFHRSLLLAVTGAASLVLAACGGGSDNTNPGALAAQSIAQERSAIADGRAAESPSLEGDVLAADAGAASREPQ